MEEFILQAQFELKPNRTAFVAYGFLVRSLYSAAFFIVLFIIGVFINSSLFYVLILAAAVLVTLFNYYSLSVQYKKEKYTFLPDKIIRSGGGIFSESETELIVRNVTHVTMKLPFLENRLFQTGRINVESAGTGRTEVALSSVDNPEKVYEYVENLMKHNGFKLAKSNLVQREKPSSLGVFFEILKPFIGLIAIILYAYAEGVSASSLRLNLHLLLSFVGLVLLVLFIRSIFQFLDLKKRVYDVYDDVITYNEGFLSKNFSFIPVENLSDSTLTQTFVDKIFGLYDVKISCQGTQQEIHFKNMANGKKLESSIDGLINKTRSLAGTEKRSGVRQAGVQKRTASHAGAFNADNSFTAEYKMDGKRTLFPFFVALPLCLIFLPFILFWIVAVISQVIKMKSTGYSVKPNGMEFRYNFISQKNTEFTNDKIMAVVFKESFVDRWFKTCSIHFWSIGSSENMKFENVKKSPGLYEAIAAKTGIEPQEMIYGINSRFSFSQMLRSSLFVTFLSSAVIIGSIVGAAAFNVLFVVPAMAVVFLYALITVYKSVYYSRSKLEFYCDYVYFEKGIFFKEYLYSICSNIKDVTTVKYPMSGRGSIKFNVAGEQIVQKNDYQVIVSNSFKIDYVDDINAKNELIDLILSQRLSAQQLAQIEGSVRQYAQKPVMVSKPDLSNSLFALIVASVVIFPLIALLPVTVPLVIWVVKAKSFIIQPHRVVSKSGILYKKQTSIAFSKVDHINFSQGALNKMFGNGSISINTVGSSRPEIVVSDIRDFREFYGMLKRHY